MAIRTIRTEGDEILRKKSKKVEVIDEKIKVRALNEKGKKIEITGKGLLAQALSHEIDHLNGEVFIDKIIPGTLEIIKPEK